jgi:hypothetical protein
MMLRSCVLLLLSTVLAACASPQPPAEAPSQGSSLPEFARPHAQPMRAEDYSATDVIRYRQVARADFRASRPPARIATNAARMGAYTCVHILPVGDPRVKVQPQPDGSLVARLGSVRFRAQMDRGCSWWNDEARLDPSYVLQHEQIHFALAEIQARRLTAEIQSIEIVERDPRLANQEIQRAFDRAARGATEALLRENTRFDEETSFRFVPAVQKRWLREVEQQLADLPPQ